MAANKSVIVLTPNGRRQNVKVTVNTTILQVLEEVCQKHGYKADDYDVKYVSSNSRFNFVANGHYNRILDVNAIFRFTGLPNNAQLEMVACTKKRLDSNVTIGIQTEGTDRVIGKFTPGDSLNQVLEQLCPDQMLPTTVLIYMHREICGIDLLKETTLRSLGLNSGRAMFRLIHRDPEQIKTQAHVSAPLVARPTQESIDIALRMAAPNRHSVASYGATQRTIDPISALKAEKGEQTSGQILDSEKHKTQATDPDPESLMNIKKRKEEEGCLEDKEVKEIPMETSESSVTEVKIKFLGERNALVFNQAIAEALPRDELPDNFFDLTVDDARHLLKDAIRLRAQLDDAPLMTSAQRELDENKRVLHHLHKYRRTVIRIQFPDQLVLQGLFGPLETVQNVKDFVKIYLTNPSSKFTLYITPPRTVLDGDTRLIDGNLVPSAILHYSGESELKAELHDKLTDPRAAGIQAVKSRMAMIRQDDANHSESEEMSDVCSWLQQASPESAPEKSGQPEPTAGPSNRSSAGGMKTTMPKWFKQPFK